MTTYAVRGNKIRNLIPLDMSCGEMRSITRVPDRVIQESEMLVRYSYAI
ncbi:MAG: hypothetical protein V1862_09700 [Methanobacteriota archaeon]